MKIELDAEIEIKIVAQSLLESIEMMYENVIDLADKESTDAGLSDYEKEDLEDSLRNLEGLKVAYKYYSIHSDWSAIDRFELNDLVLVVDKVDLLIDPSEL